MKIGIVCYPTYGGSGAVATELGRLLARRDHVIHFISYSRPFRLINDYHPNIFHHEINSEHYPLFQGELYSISVATKMVDVVRNFGLDLLHVHYALPHSISAWLAMQMLREEERIPHVTTLHGTDITLVGSKPSFMPAVQLGLDKGDHLTAVSNWLAARTRQIFEVSQRIEIIYNFVDVEVFKPGMGLCKRKHLAAPEEKILMHISNFRPVKRVADVVRVFAKVRERMKARLLMIGDGPDREQAEVLADQLGVGEHVMWLGKQAAVEQYLPCADLFLFPTDGESFGLAGLEAMACGVPVIGALAGGLPEVVVHGETGALHKVGDVEAMAESAIELLSDGALMRRMKEQSRQRVVENFTAEKIIPQYENLYKRILGERPVEV